MKRNIKLYLQDIWESTLAIEEYTQNLTEDKFYSNRQVQDAIDLPYIKQQMLLIMERENTREKNLP